MKKEEKTILRTLSINLVLFENWIVVTESYIH